MENGNSDVKHYDYIDALRGFAILGVLIFHAAPNFSTISPHWFGVLVSQGARGVQLFYVLSALTLCLSFISRSKKENFPIRNFYIRRFFRIAPLFYLAVIFYVLLYGNTFSFWNIISTFIFVNGLSPYWINNIVPGGWSITVEMTFYLVFPLLIYYLTNLKRALIGTIISIFVCQLIRLNLAANPLIDNLDIWQEFTFLFFISQLPVFLIGITTYFLVIQKKFSDGDLRLLKIGGLLILVDLVLQLIAGWKIIAGHYIYGIIFGVICVFLAKHKLKFLVNKFSCYLGKISFSLYLSHFAVLYFLQSNFSIENYFIRLVLLITFSSVVSTILYFTVERYGILAGKELIRVLETGKIATNKVELKV